MTWRWTILGILLALGVFLLASPSNAQAPRCGPVPAVLDALNKKFGEKPAGAGKIKNAPMMFMLTRSDDGSWSFIRIIGDQACVMATGHGWKAAEPGEPT